MASDIGHLTRRAFMEMVVGSAAMAATSALSRISFAEPRGISVRPNAKEWFSPDEMHKFLELITGEHIFKSPQPKRDIYHESWEQFVVRVKQHQPDASDIESQVERFKKNYEGRYKVLGMPIERVLGFHNEYIVEARGFPIDVPGRSYRTGTRDFLLPLSHIPNLKTPFLKNPEVVVTCPSFFKWYPNHKSLFILQADPREAEKIVKGFGGTLFYAYEFSLRIDCPVGPYQETMFIPSHVARPLVRQGILYPGNHQEWGAHDWIGVQEYPLHVQLFACTTRMRYTIDRLVLYIDDRTSAPQTAYGRIHGIKKPFRSLPPKGIIFDNRANLK